jgi:hypothetical protein
MVFTPLISQWFAQQCGMAIAMIQASNGLSALIGAIDCVVSRRLWIVLAMAGLIAPVLRIDYTARRFEQF